MLSGGTFALLFYKCLQLCRYLHPGGNTTLVTLVIELLQVMTTFHPNDYFEHVTTTLTQVMTIFVKFYVIL